MNAQKGFTLIELVVVMSIMAIIAAVAFPSFSSRRQMEATEDIKRLERQYAKALRQYYMDYGEKVLISTSVQRVNGSNASIPNTSWIKKLENGYGAEINENYDYIYKAEGLFGKVQVTN